MKEFISVAKALSDENRARILLALGGRELCVCQVVELLGLAGSTVSRHMAILRQSGLVTARKDGRWIYYRSAPRGCTGAASSLARAPRSGAQAIAKSAAATARAAVVVIAIFIAPPFPGRSPADRV